MWSEAYKRGMTSTGHAAEHPWRLPFGLGPVIARAKRAARQHPVLIAAAVVVVGGGAAGAAVALNAPNAVRAAAACAAPGPPYYAYAVPPDPAHPPAAASGPTSWGWMPRMHPVKVGDRIRVSGRLWQVTEIATMPGVEPLCRPFGIVGVSVGSPFEEGLIMAGRLVLRPVG